MSGDDYQRRYGDWLYEAGAAYDHGSPLFGGVTMSVLHYVGQPEFTDAELADLIVDRFLYGHAVR